ncbi:MAG: recombinase family protein [Oscillospiraceae bacterium]|nr:recombinase family protein [Oscillospiraceae bacterium]
MQNNDVTPDNTKQDTSQEKEKRDSKKDAIRKRYQGLNPDEIDVIPALPKESFFEDRSEKRVAIYVRVSTDDPRQTSSYELQKNHYTDLVEKHEGWNLVEIYADEGLSGTTTAHRKAFIKMIEDCKEGKIDIIVTKTVARFARNILDCIGEVRMLAALKQPVGVFFETENIYTLDGRSEMALSFISTLAQEESRNKSEIMNASIEMRFKRGLFLTPPLLGYDNDEDGNLVINEDEARTVKLAFLMYLHGHTCMEIAEIFTNLGRKTKKNNTSWSPNSILQILQNERHCGDVLARKTFTPNFLDHKSKKNRQDRNQYRKQNNHKAIIPRDDFIAVQRLISNAKYGNKGILPELRVISEGTLKGFVSIHPRWAAFSADDYRMASAAVYNEPFEPTPINTEVTVQSGEFDLRGYEIARSQFFNTAKKLCVTFSTERLWFSSECTKKLTKELYVEMLVHPEEQLLAIRPSKKDNKCSVKWMKLSDDTFCPRVIQGTAFLKTLYNIYGWNHECKYRIRGTRHEKEKSPIIVFDMRETEVFIPDETTEDYLNENTHPIITGFSKNIAAFPPAWAGSFGYNYYSHAQAREIAALDKNGAWNVTVEGKTYISKQELNITDTDLIAGSIEEILKEIEQGDISIESNN